MSITYDVKVLADSISPDGVRLTTLQCRYPRFIHSEMLRHRVFSHSVASSRAIPTEKQIERVRENPFVPETFNKRVKGMGVGEALDPEAQQDARDAWLWAADHAAMIAEKLNAIGIDKSRANRLLEPFIWVDDIITATEWDNFFALRDHPAAQPEFQILAQIMRAALKTSEPRHVGYDSWHLPYVKDEEVKEDLARPTTTSSRGSSTA
jgi:thymidylate synthase ThyX